MLKAFQAEQLLKELDHELALKQNKRNPHTVGKILSTFKESGETGLSYLLELLEDYPWTCDYLLRKIISVPHPTVLKNEKISNVVLLWKTRIENPPTIEEEAMVETGE